MSPVDSFIHDFPNAKQRALMLYFHDLLLSNPTVIAKMRYQLPFYDQKSWVCYLRPTKIGLVELSFIHGKELSNVQGLLENKGRKQVCSLIFADLADVPEVAVREVIQEALLLDEWKSGK